MNLNLNMDSIHLYNQIMDKSLSLNSSKRNTDLKEKYEQYYTPVTIANYMSKFFKESSKSSISMLDPGAGLGNLTVAFVLTVLKWKKRPKEIKVTLYEIDSNVINQLISVMKTLKSICLKQNVNFTWNIFIADFIKAGSNLTKLVSFDRFDYIIMNPPYKKLNVDSNENKYLIDAGIDVSNFYTAFVGIAQRLLINNGELVAITPRSFCNGVYFTKFREDFKQMMIFSNIHLFDSRTAPFSEDEVLQETIIYHCIKAKWSNSRKVNIIHSTDDSFQDKTVQRIKLNELIYPTDKKYIIRIIKSADDKAASTRIESLPCTLDDLQIEVSTGPVVDFRETEGVLSQVYIENSVPYLTCNHIRNGSITWPSQNAKYNYILQTNGNTRRLKPNGNYLLVRRMSSKEEKRRIACGVINQNMFSSHYLGFDNKTNYIHQSGSGINLNLAKGLCLYLSSSAVDLYFRIFSGHTQVNVSDLKSIRYPTRDQLEAIGTLFVGALPDQDEIDQIVDQIIFT